MEAPNCAFSPSYTPCLHSWTREATRHTSKGSPTWERKATLPWEENSQNMGGKTLNQKHTSHFQNFRNVKLNHICRSKLYLFPKYHTIFTFTGKRGLAAYIKGFHRVREKATLPWEENPQNMGGKYIKSKEIWEFQNQSYMWKFNKKWINN